jgi:ADP-heptose:LPS heptosyltransferase
MWKKDCKEFNGIIPCDELKNPQVEHCGQCNFPRPYDEKVLIIKLGAKGDVVRSLSVLKPIRKKHKNVHITWLITKSNKGVLKGQKVDTILTLSPETQLRLEIEKFDHVYNLEYDMPASAIMTKIKAKNKYGYYLDEKALPATYLPEGQQFLDIAFSDKLNLKNTKTYQKMIFDALGLEYNRETYKLKIDKEYKRNFKEKNSIKEDEIIVGINLGTAKRWPSKAWKKQYIIDLIKKLPYKVIILGGPHEIELQKEIAELTGAIPNDPKNTDQEFFSVVDICNVVITGDTFALHVALGLKKPTVALLFCTSANEIETYDLATKFISPLLEQNYYTEKDSEELRSSITVDQVYNQILNILKNGRKKFF